ncbi:hypothetical protein ACFLWR_03880 [Chloroflexota bacterium]
MAISEKQLKANKENAKRGGVKTKEGKSKSRLNAVKHGLLLTSQILLPGEDDKEMAQFRDSVILELKLYGELELFLLDRLIICAWRLRRAIGIETNLILGLYKNRAAEDPNVLAYDKLRAEIVFIHGHSVEKISRYEAAIERQLYKALNELNELLEKRNK